MVTDLPPQVQVSGFSVRVKHRAADIRSWLCVGLDPVPGRLPRWLPPTPDGVVEFCQAIVDATAHTAAAFKVNTAFFEALGPAGWEALFRVRQLIPPEVPVIADAKRGDIPSTAEAYAAAILDGLHFDAITVSPYLGWDAIAPFLARAGKGAIVLCRTSNPGAPDLQELLVEGEPLYMHVAREALALRAAGDVALVVGATAPQALRAVRALDDNVILLVPGVGAQGGPAQKAIVDAQNAEGNNALINVSREILYASTGDSFADAAREIAERRARETWKGP